MTLEAALRKHLEPEWGMYRDCGDEFGEAPVRHPSHRDESEWKLVRPRPHESHIVRFPSQRATTGSLAEAVELRQLADEWKEATLFMSSTQDQFLHPAYQKIIGFGEKALPFLIDELRTSDDYWFWALEMITRADPVPANENGNYRAMKEAWLNWAALNNL